MGDDFCRFGHADLFGSGMPENQRAGMKYVVITNAVWVYGGSTPDIQLAVQA